MIVNNEHLYGPGNRLLVFLQGCSIHCEGCINKHLWDFDGGKPTSTKEIVDIITANNLEGITLHGGEPLDQAAGLLEIVKELKKLGKTIILFTGYTKKELDKTKQNVWNLSDMVVAGRFQLSKRNVYLQFRGSINQKVHRHKGNYKNYKIKDGSTAAIITMDEDGNMDINGFLTDEIAELTKKK